MGTTQDILASKRWLSRATTALDDACVDASFASKNGRPVYLAFDPSFIFPPLALRDRLDIANPADWLDISANLIFENIDKYSSETLGYQLVMTYPTFLTIQRNYQIDVDLIDQIENSQSDDDIFELIKRKIPIAGRSNSAPGSPNDIDEALSNFLVSTQKKHARLSKLRDYIRSGKITTEYRVFEGSHDLLRRANVTLEEFLDLRKMIDKYRQVDRPLSQSDSFIRGIEAFEIISTRKMTDLYTQGRLLFMAWPRSRGYYSNPQKYHRVNTSIFFKLMCLLETPSSGDVVQGANSHLYDLRDQFRFALRKVNYSEKEKVPLTPPILKTITSLRDDHLRNLRGETKIMEDEERKKLVRGFQGSRREVREILAEVRSQTRESAKTLAELAAEFRVEETTSGWESLQPDAPIRMFLDGIKPIP